MELCLLFKGCMIHSTLWQLLKEKGIKFPAKMSEIKVQEDFSKEEEPEEENNEIDVKGEREI